MARINIYISKEDEPVYDKAKEYAGGPISAVIVDLLKGFIAAREREISGMAEIPLLIGEEDYGSHESRVEGIKFVGRELASWSKKEYQDVDEVAFQVFRTQKGKLLVYEVYYVGMSVTRKYRVFDALSGFVAAGYPPELVTSVTEGMPEVQFRVLDI